MCGVNGVGGSGGSGVRETDEVEGIDVGLLFFTFFFLDEAPLRDEVVYGCGENLGDGSGSKSESSEV